MTKLLTGPHEGLPPSFSPLVMRLVESHSNLCTQNRILEEEMQKADEDRDRAVVKLEKGTADFILKSMDYESEIGKLKNERRANKAKSMAVISRSKGSPASKKQAQNRQTVYEFLKSSHGEPMLEPSYKMTPRAPQAPPPFGRPSEDSISSFSSFADTLSDVDDVHDVCRDRDFPHVRFLAELMARRHNIKLGTALAQLSDTFFSDVRRPSASPRSVSSVDNTLDFKFDLHPENLHPTLVQSPIKDNGVRGHRQSFSFDAGDDSTLHFSTSDGYAAVDKSPLYKRSVSLTDLPSHPNEDDLRTPPAIASNVNFFALSHFGVRSPGAQIDPLHTRTINVPSSSSDILHGRPDIDDNKATTAHPTRKTSSSSTTTVLRRSPLDHMLSGHRGLRRVQGHGRTESSST